MGNKSHYKYMIFYPTVFKSKSTARSMFSFLYLVITDNVNIKQLSQFHKKHLLQMSSFTTAAIYANPKKKCYTPLKGKKLVQMIIMLIPYVS